MASRVSEPKVNWRNLLGHIFHNHSHGDTTHQSRALLATEEGIHTVWIALALLGLTTVIQVVIVWLSGSVALFADTAHNLGDALNSLPLLLAFYLARRLPTRRFSYGYGRAEDLAGVVIVLSMIGSAFFIFWESYQKLFNPQTINNLSWVVVAAVIGFLGNEAVAWLQIRVGRKINSEALIADGMHARVDALTSLAVLIAALGSFFGFPILDPIIGILIGITILFITKDATSRVWYRLLDAIDPSITNRIEELAAELVEVRSIRARWVGHELFANLEISLANDLSIDQQQLKIRQLQEHVLSHMPYAMQLAILTMPALNSNNSAHQTSRKSILPPRYQGDVQVSAAPMGAAGLEYNDDGSVAWNEIWSGFCELALAGGPPHRGTLLEPVSPEQALVDQQAYNQAYAELERGLTMITGLQVVPSETPGWIGLVCESEEMALWLVRAIVVENVSVRREGKTLFFPVSPDFRLAYEIKSVITVTAKTTHYWQEHVAQTLR